MPRVMMLKQTKWNGKPLLPGDELEVDSNTAKRWNKARIAEVTEIEIVATEVEGGEEDVPVSNVCDSGESGELPRSRPKRSSIRQSEVTPESE